MKLQSALAALLIAPATLLAAQAPPTAKAPPNIVIIISDDHHWTDYGFMRHPHIQTPHVDKLASQSLTFTRYDLPAREPADASPDKPSRNWSLINRINQKNRRPEMPRCL